VLNTSASGLETFAACPFRHFARHVLRLEKRPEAILTPLSTGSAVHAALERFFADPEPPDSPEAARARLETIFRALADEEDFAIFQADPPSAYRWELTGRNLARFIRAEHRRLERSTFRPAAVELGFGAESATADDAARLRERLEHAEPAAGARLPALEFTVESGAGETWRVRLRGRIDRLDVSTGGDGPRLGLVVDYKSRAAQRSPRERLERGHDLQLAAYLWVVRDVIGLAPAGGVYYSVRPCPHAPGEPVPEANELRFAMQGFVAEDTRAAVDPEAAFGLKAASSPAAAIDETLATARGQIARLAAGIVGGRIRPDPQSATGRLPCEICDFREMCRYDRAAGTRSAEGSEP
jgi:ATP-dependent helicase/nuclease subunit B